MPGIPAAQWPLERFAQAARHFGQLNGAYLAGRPLPAVPWLNTQWRREWVEVAGIGRLDALLAHFPAAWNHLDVQSALPDPLAFPKRLARLRERYPALLAGLERLPPALCHIDPHSRNLLADGDRTIALDWALMGIGTVGDDLGQLVAATLLFGDVAPEQADVFWTSAAAGYDAGLGDAGWSGMRTQPEVARQAAAASMVLRWGFTVPALLLELAHDPTAQAGAEREWGVPAAMLVQRFGALATFLLDRADEALTCG
jgi:hypothetical protein